MEQRSAEWFEARKGRITGSIIGAIMGLDPNRSREDVLRDKVREHFGVKREFEGNIATVWGTNHEAEAREAFEYDRGYKVQEASFVVHDTISWLGASPDGFVGDDAVVEIKCPFGLRKDEPPVNFKTLSEQKHYFYQIQLQLFVTGRSTCYFWQWTPRDQRLEVVYYDPVAVAELWAAAQAFRADLQEAIKAPEAHLRDKRVDIDGAQLVAEYDDVVAEIEALEARKKELMDKMVAMSGGSDATIAGRKLTLVQRAGAISYASAVKELLPGVDLEKWRGKPTSYWKLT